MRRALVLTVLALLLSALPAGGQTTGASPSVGYPTLSRSIHDEHGYLGTPSDELIAAIDDLYAVTGARLYVLFVDTTRGEPIASYYDSVRSANRAIVGPDDALFIVAVQDRQAQIGAGRDLFREVDQAELDAIFEEVRTYLRDDRWTEAVNEAAEGLKWAWLFGDRATPSETPPFAPSAPTPSIQASPAPSS
jgi:uncharacterized membrane protein YgcG